MKPQNGGHFSSEEVEPAYRLLASTLPPIYAYCCCMFIYLLPPSCNSLYIVTAPDERPGAVCYSLMWPAAHDHNAGTKASTRASMQHPRPLTPLHTQQFGFQRIFLFSLTHFLGHCLCFLFWALSWRPMAFRFASAAYLAAFAKYVALHGSIPRRSHLSQNCHPGGFSSTPGPPKFKDA